MKLQILVVLQFLLTFSFLECRSQIVVDNVGEGWKSKVDSSIAQIRQIDSSKYFLLLKYCSHIGYINDKTSTIEYPGTILLSTMDMKSGKINDISAAIVHESRHLYYSDIKTTLSDKNQEINCYLYELDYLRKIPNVDNYLINNCLKMIKYFSQK